MSAGGPEREVAAPYEGDVANGMASETPLVGWDIMTRDLKKSGRARADRPAVTAPKSWPTSVVTES